MTKQGCVHACEGLRACNTTKDPVPQRGDLRQENTSAASRDSPIGRTRQRRPARDCHRQPEAREIDRESQRLPQAEETQERGPAEFKVTSARIFDSIRFQQDLRDYKRDVTARELPDASLRRLEVDLNDATAETGPS
jgi:hypothetical protein